MALQNVEKTTENIPLTGVGNDFGDVEEVEVDDGDDNDKDDDEEEERPDRARRLPRAHADSKFFSGDQR